MFADDIKPFYRIDSLCDCLLSPGRPSSFRVMWSFPDHPKMLLNDLFILIFFSYSINNVSLNSLGDSTNDLGFILIRTLCLVKYTEKICYKALNIDTEFCFSYHSRVLYDLLLKEGSCCALVRPVLVYGCVLQDPSSSGATCQWNDEAWAT